MSGGKNDALFLTGIIFKKEKWEHVFFFPAISKAYILIYSTAQYQLGSMYLMWKYIKKIGKPVPKQH